MNKIINKRQAICGTVWIFIFCIIVSLWPLRLVKETVVSHSNRQIAMESEAITTDYVVKQMFVAQYDKLKNIKVYLLNESAGEEFNFVLYDASMNILMQQIISTDDMDEMPGFCTIQVNQDVEVGREYYYLIQGISADFYVAYEDTATSGTIYNGTLYYGNVEDTEHNIISEYDYTVPLRKGKTVLVDALLVLFGILVTFLTGKYYGEHPEKNELLTVEKVFKTVCNPIVVVAGAGCMLAIWPGHLFTEDAVSVLFYEAGVLLAVLILLYGINHKREHKRNDLGFSVVQDRWTDWLQAAMFAAAIGACCNYMNGLYEIHHTLAYREMLIYFGLAVIVTYRKKEIFNLVNMIYLPVAAVTGYFYYQNHIIGLTEAEKIQAVKLTVWAAVIAGVIIINTVSILVRKKIRRISPGYGILLAVFFALLIIYRNTRGWPIYLVCAFSLYYLRMAAWEKKERLLQNICNGILLHFLVMMVYCLEHRPYMFYIYYRYPFIFHTVTMSAVYLALVVCAALVKLLDAYRKCPRLAGVWKELTVFGFSAIYLLFTLSRTGYLAIAVTAIIVIPTVCFSMQKRFRLLCRAVAMMCLSVILCFPVVFTAQRILPSVVAEPKLHEIEELPSEVEHGRVMDSDYYITIQRFIQVFQMKVLGMPEEKCMEANSIVKNDTMQDIGDEMLLASSEVSGEALPEEEEEQESDAASYANGRFEIFRLYYENLNTTGHDDMGITLPDGSLVVHAHNIYLQTAYDHGIFVGIVFILVGFGTLVQGFLYFIRRKDERSCVALPFAILILFAVAGLTEWIFHPCSPIAYCLLLTLAPLLFDMKKSGGRNK